MGKTDRVTVHLDEKPIYDIVLTDSFELLAEEVAKQPIEGRKLCVVTDSNVAPLYLEEVEKVLSGVCSKVIHFIMPAGEQNKNLGIVQKLYETLILAHFDRKDMLVALGGGVVGDLCGFTAATYLRGVNFIQIPTTLLSEVDSSIGGKTGVDFDSYKNMVGAFHMPKLVYINISTLKTLPKEQFSAGMGEVIKHGLIKNKEYYAFLKDNKEAIKAMDADALRTTVALSNEVKRLVVEKDPTEKGDRMLLNFGHTLGHAIEKLMNFELLHGECVALGALAAMHISAERGLITEEEVEDYRQTMLAFDIKDKIAALNADDVILTTKSDKKMDAGRVKFILLNSVGDAFVDYTVSDEEMKHALEYIFY